MKRLFHSFPRPIVRRQAGSISCEDGYRILEFILRCGLLCAPERFPLFAEGSTERPEKIIDSHPRYGYGNVIQSRACFTLLDWLELSQQYRPSEYGPDERWSHAELFGEFAIGLDPIEAREIGILPVVYTYRQDQSPASVAGLGSQIVHRIDEIRTILAILSQIEERAGLPFAAPWKMLDPLASVLKYEPRVIERLNNLSADEARTIFSFFDTDRISAWNTADIVTMLMGLYQTTDSTLSDAPLAFFQQREWRLIHHVSVGSSEWFGLEDHSEYRNPWASKYKHERSKIAAFIKDIFERRGKNKEEQAWALAHTWVLVQANGRPFHDYVREIVVPHEYVSRTRKLISQLPFRRPPVVRTLADLWRIEVVDGRPTIVNGTNPELGLTAVAATG